VYDQPANVFVAGFIGSPPMNLLHGRAGGGRITAGDLRMDMPEVPDGDVVVGVRPEALRPSGDGLSTIEFRVDVVEPLGDEIVVHGSVAGRAAGTGPSELETPTKAMGGDPGEATITARFEPHLRPQIGDRIPLHVRAEAVHVFDPATGRAIGRPRSSPTPAGPT
jgi:multiple sugar transport system ATP-binding protein